MQHSMKVCSLLMSIGALDAPLVLFGTFDTVICSGNGSVVECEL